MKNVQLSQTPRKDTNVKRYAENLGAKTIKGDLEEALYFYRVVSEHDRDDRAQSARTDPLSLVDSLNSNLPSQIRIFGYKHVTSSFNAKFCDQRRYVYLFPVFGIDPSCHSDRDCHVMMGLYGWGFGLFFLFYVYFCRD